MLCDFKAVEKRARLAQPRPEVEEGKGIIAHLLRLQGWKVRRGEIVRTFSFGKGSEVSEFLTEVTEIGRDQIRTPKIALGFRQCRIALKTRPLNHVTEHELILASRLDALARTYPTFKRA